jgi:FAD/FMN-containing dehydrogenase
MKSRRVSRRAFLDAGVALPIAWGARPQASVASPLEEGPTLDACDDNETFRNWARTINCRPARYCQPRSTEEVVGIVKDALQAGKKVRAVGAGHSWSPLVLTGDVLVNLDRMASLTVDTARRTATMQAGIRLKNLTRGIAEKGLGMANLGSVQEQSITGATATGTHGTGVGLGILSTQILGMKLVTGTGEVLSIGAADAERLAAARVGLGALGIVTEVTLQCVPVYDLEFKARFAKFDDVVPTIDALVRNNTRVRLWWLVPSIGPRDFMVVTTMNPPTTEAGTGARERSGGGLREPLPMDAEALAATAAALAGAPTEAALAPLTFVARYDKVMTLPPFKILHRECEYAIPVASAAEALLALRRAVVEGDLSMKMPVEVRFAAKDDILLSPARSRDVCYIGISTEDNATEVFDRFEPIMRRLGGRPHWGKCFSLVRKDLEAMYPDSYERFRALRKELDPRGVFANELMQQLFD